MVPPSKENINKDKINIITYNVWFAWDMYGEG